MWQTIVLPFFNVICCHVTGGGTFLSSSLDSASDHLDAPAALPPEVKPKCSRQLDPLHAMETTFHCSQVQVAVKQFVHWDFISWWPLRAMYYCTGFPNSSVKNNNVAIDRLLIYCLPFYILKHEFHLDYIKKSISYPPGKQMHLY